MRIGSLFSGYGGLDAGVMDVLGGSVAWHVEFDPAPSKILAHHWPDVPNYGDITKVDWAEVEPVDVLTGGSPCQDLSHAGKRAGMTEGTRSNLWVAMREAIAQLRPSLVVWENVRGAYSAAADSEVEPCAGCVGDGSGVNLRALGRVLGDLADLGFDAAWHGLRAADVGAPHGRFRVFLVAYPHSTAGRVGLQPGKMAGEGGCSEGEAWARLRQVARGGGGDHDPSEGVGGSLLPTPRSSDTNDPGAHGQGGVDLRTAVSLLPTPRATDGTKGGPNQRGSSGDLMLPSAVTLLPTPTSMDAHASGGGYNGQGNVTLTDATVRRTHGPAWGDYAPAIARWEALTRPAPPPTQLSTKGNPQLSPAFVEWVMGLPEGHVTSVPGLSRNHMLKALGNGVVPQQAAAALRYLLAVVPTPQETA